MKTIKVLGSGCKKCTNLAELIQSIVDEQQISAKVVKETSPEAIMGYGVMSTPAIVIDEQLVHSGSVPAKEALEEMVKG